MAWRFRKPWDIPYSKYGLSLRTGRVPETGDHARTKRPIFNLLKRMGRHLIIESVGLTIFIF